MKREEEVAGPKERGARKKTIQGASIVFVASNFLLPPILFGNQCCLYVCKSSDLRDDGVLME